MALATVPKFYKSVIDDVISQMREIFLDDGVDDQVIQDIKLTWEKKILESRAVELEPKPQLNETLNTSSSTTNNASSVNNSSSSNQKASEKNKSASQQSGQQGQTTSVITSNPNHVQKNGTTNSKHNKNNKNNNNGNNNNNNNNIANMVKNIKTEIDDNSSATLIQPQSMIPKAIVHPTVMVKQSQSQLTNTTNIIGQPLAQPGQLAPGTVSQAEQMFRTSAIISNNSIGLATPPCAVSGTNASPSSMLQEVKFQPSGIIPGQKVVFVPNQLMAQPGTGPFILNSDLINTFNMPASGIIAPTGHQVISHPGAIQYIRSGIPVPSQATVIPTAMIRGPIVQTSLSNPVVATQSSSQAGGQGINSQRVAQMDGPMNQENDSSDEDDDDDDYRDNDDDIDDNEDEMNDEENEGGVEEEPLNSEDDVSDEDPVELFETDNVVVCQYDKITRSRNKWKFHFKDGIMNLQGKDYVFSRAVGDAEW